MKLGPCSDSTTLVWIARLFSVLDAIIVALQVPIFVGYATGSVIWSGASSFLLITFLAIAISAVLWGWQLPGRCLITYLLFPVRIATAALSFAWLADLVLAVFPSTGLLFYVVWWGVILIEFVRLLTTIWLQRSRTTLQEIPAPTVSKTVFV